MKPKNRPLKPSVIGSRESRFLKSTLFFFYLMSIDKGPSIPCKSVVKTEKSTIDNHNYDCFVLKNALLCGSERKCDVRSPPTNNTTTKRKGKLILYSLILLRLVSKDF